MARPEDVDTDITLELDGSEITPDSRARRPWGVTTKKDQVEKFKKVAREPGVDEDEAAFDDKLKRITPKPKPKEKAPDK